MEFWKSYSTLLISPGFGSERSYIGTKQRPHASIHSIYKKAIKLDLCNHAEARYDASSARYIMAENINFDMFVSIYDVNTTRAFACRMGPDMLPHEISRAMASFVSKIRKPNLELRIIGLQNNTAQASGIISMVHKSSKAGLTELDIFGHETRHLCLDTKTGLVYNLLLENRHYRPGELVNSITKEQFDAQILQLQK